jgi:hypothetical protein
MRLICCPFCAFTTHPLPFAHALAGSEKMPFTAALHTYFKISAIGNVSVTGLDGITYTDSLQGGQSVQQSGDVIFNQEVDRIYLAVPDSGVQVWRTLVGCCNFCKPTPASALKSCRAEGWQMAWQCTFRARLCLPNLTVENAVPLYVPGCLQSQSNCIRFEWTCQLNSQELSQSAASLPA